MNKLFLYFGFLMVLVYFFAGAWLIFFGERLFDKIPRWVRIASGCLLIAYGVFRLFRYRNMANQER